MQRIIAIAGSGAAPATMEAPARQGFLSQRVQALLQSGDWGNVRFAGAIAGQIDVERGKLMQDRMRQTAALLLGGSLLSCRPASKAIFSGFRGKDLS